MGILTALIIGFLAGGLLSYFYHDAAMADLKLMKAQAEKERDYLRGKYKEALDNFKAR